MASLRPRPQVMRLTDAAAAHIKDILGRAEGPIAGVRVGVKNGGCAGTEMDFKVDKLSSGFVFNNPNQTSACGCGESVALTPATEHSAPLDS